MNAYHGETIWIVGASSGIGEALTRELAAQGARLVLSARREAELQRLNEALGGGHLVLPLDVADSDAIAAAAQRVSAECEQLDRVIFMAALYRPAEIAERDVAFTKTLIDVNLTAAILLTYAVLPMFDAQQKGQMVLCGSVAGYTGLPGGQPYSATKAAIANFAESLYAEVKDHISVKLISPGFVRTRITDKNDFPMPMRIEPEQAAKIIAKGLNKGAFEIHFPKTFTLAVKFLHALPYSATLWLTRKMRGKA